MSAPSPYPVTKLLCLITLYVKLYETSTKNTSSCWQAEWNGKVEPSLSVVLVQVVHKYQQTFQSRQVFKRSRRELSSRFDSGSFIRSEYSFRTSAAYRPALVNRLETIKTMSSKNYKRPTWEPTLPAQISADGLYFLRFQQKPSEYFRHGKMVQTPEERTTRGVSWTSLLDTERSISHTSNVINRSSTKPSETFKHRQGRYGDIIWPRVCFYVSVQWEPSPLHFNHRQSKVSARSFLGPYKLGSTTSSGPKKRSPRKGQRLGTTRVQWRRARRFEASIYGF